MAIQHSPKLTLEGHTLAYKGDGVKKALIFDLYNAAFYTNDLITSTADVIEKNVPKILVTTILTPLLNGIILSQVFKEALAKTHYGQLPEIQDDVSDILEIFKNGSIKRHDRFEFLSTPEKGFTAFQNGVKQYTCSNFTLTKAIFEVYFGSYHRDQSLPKRIAGL
ncbi:MAG: chalcone isomerase family protein [Chitinophagales bacterium]